MYLATRHAIYSAALSTEATAAFTDRYYQSGSLSFIYVGSDFTACVFSFFSCKSRQDFADLHVWKPARVHQQQEVCNREV